MIYKFNLSSVVVPFPFTDTAKKKRRPALVISTEAFQKESGHITLLMITTAKQSHWHSDLPIEDLETAGLPAASYIRQKIFTLDARLIEKKIGHLSTKESTLLKKRLKSHLCL